jgi:ABC-2 type transport system permease protein
VTDILYLARTHVVAALRERITLFWFLVFPVFLLTILALIFGRSSQEDEIHFDIALVNRDVAAPADGFSAHVETIFTEMSRPGVDGTRPLFSLYTPSPDETHESFLDREETALRRGDRAAIVIVPAGFHDDVLAGVVAHASSEPPSLEVWMSQNDIASEMATAIIEQIIVEIDREILAQAGRFDLTSAIGREQIWVGEDASGEVRYVDFLLPGVILMGFFTNGLFGVPGAILFNRDRKVLRRYWVTPLPVGRYFVGFALGHLALCVLQFVLLFLLGRFAFGARVSFAQLDVALLLVLAAVTFMAFGFLIASLARTANAGMAIANVLNMPMMFLSGLFFPTGGLPTFLAVIAAVNPVTYLVEGLRTSLGVQAASTSPILLLGVPLGWIAVSAVIASRRLRWDVAR